MSKTRTVPWDYKNKKVADYTSCITCVKSVYVNEIGQWCNDCGHISHEAIFSSGNPESEAGKAIIASAEDKNITVSFFRVGVVRIMSILAGDLYDKYIITMQEQSDTVKYCRAICKKHTKTFSLEAFLI